MRTLGLLSIVLVLVIVRYQFVLCGGRKANLKHSRRPFIIKCCGGSKCSASFMHKPKRRSSDFKTSSTQGHFQTAVTKNESRDYENYPFETETSSSAEGIASSEPTDSELTTVPILKTEAKTTLTKAVTVTKTPTTTSTTAKPINIKACKLSRCANFTLIANQSVSQVISASTSKIIVKNGTTFLFSTAAATQVDAAKNCFSRKLNLISLQNVLKMNLVQKLLQDFGTDSAVWTIGSNEGNTSCQNYDLSFAWCNPKREIVLPVIMQKLNSLDLVQKGLTTLMLNGAAALKTSDSNSLFPFLCEPKDEFQDTCLALKCNKDSTLFDANGNVKDGEKYGKWTRTCDKLYLFSNKLGTWQQGWDLCCNLGMKPIWFSSATDFECLSNTTKANWTLNWNYWTAGRAMGTWGRWAWCPGAVNLPDSLSWAPGQPDNNQTDENCLHVQVTKNASGILLSDRNCSHKYIMACQGDALMASTCNKPNCSMQCSKNESIFKDGLLTDLFAHGQWNAGCGKDYLFSAETLDWLGAWKYCCSIGMKLASIEALEELNCLTNMVAKFPRAAYPDQCGRDFWTSGTNRGCPGAHFWCSDDEKLNTEELANWKNGQMPSESADQCIFINLSNSTLSDTHLGADACTNQKPFLCEALQPGTKSMQIERTCKEIWNVTDSEVNDIIMNPSGDVVNQRRNLKCYLRCCGKKGNVIKTGSLVKDTILRNLEDLTADDPEAMQNGFQNFDSCTSIQSTDECHTMAQMFQCGKKNDADLTLGLVTAIKGDATVSVTATGGIQTGGRLCPLYPAESCVPNQTNIDELKNTGSSLGGRVMTTSNGKKYFMKYVFYEGITDAQAEANYCCALGSHLAIFESLADFNDFGTLWKGVNENYGHVAHIGPTFDNGDGTDSWCLNFKRLPAGMITNINTFYRNQQWNSTRILLEQSAGLHISPKGNGAHQVLCGPIPY
ncbi:Hypothetical predicted protein [Cloeon dipterum]|uniref:C-type lectin domain-containing protein n=1 Tax=Cloeon dipterum TaxID=197152 RepID=A0A8S1CG97_9INSE|nr:Hypothetical predicted protein [Cloeon dipterum]